MTTRSAVWDLRARLSRRLHGPADEAELASVAGDADAIRALLARATSGRRRTLARLDFLPLDVIDALVGCADPAVSTAVASNAALAPGHVDVLLELDDEAVSRALLHNPAVARHAWRSVLSGTLPSGRPRRRVPATRAPAWVLGAAVRHHDPAVVWMGLDGGACDAVLLLGARSILDAALHQLDGRARWWPVPRTGPFWTGAALVGSEVVRARDRTLSGVGTVLAGPSALWATRAQVERAAADLARVELAGCGCHRWPSASRAPLVGDFVRELRRALSVRGVEKVDLTDVGDETAERLLRFHQEALDPAAVISWCERTRTSGPVGRVTPPVLVAAARSGLTVDSTFVRHAHGAAAGPRALAAAVAPATPPRAVGGPDRPLRLQLADHMRARAGSDDAYRTALALVDIGFSGTLDEACDVAASLEGDER